jgi:hypothetical protein
MASSSIATNPLLGHIISDKLSKNNHMLWKAQVLPVVHGVRLEGFLIGTPKMSDEHIITTIDEKEVKKPNSMHEAWVALDQQVLCFLLSLASCDVLQQVATSKTAIATWKTIESAFGSQTHACAVNTCIALATTQKDNLSITEYVNKMRMLADEMVVAGKPLDDEEMVSYILAGLDLEYNYVVSVVVTRIKPISVTEL